MKPLEVIRMKFYRLLALGVLALMLVACGKEEAQGEADDGQGSREEDP